MKKNDLEKNKMFPFIEAFWKGMALELKDKLLIKSFILPLKIVKIDAFNNVEFETDLSKNSLSIIKSTMDEKIRKVLCEIFEKENVTYSITTKKVKKIDINEQNDSKLKEKEAQKSVSKVIKNIYGNLIKDFTFEKYVKGDFNKDAIRIAKMLALGDATFNPVFISANSGLGKTHLLNAIANDFLKTNQTVIYLNPGEFVTDITILLQENNQEKIKKRLSELNNADLLMFDDFQYYGQGNKKSTLQVINQILDFRILNKKVTVFASDKGVSSLNNMFDSRLISRLTSGLQVEIKPPKQDDLLKILEHFIYINKMHPDNWEDEAKNFIVRNFKKSIRSLIGAISTLNFYNRDITEKANGCYTKEIVNKILCPLSNNKERISPDSVIECVAKYYKVNKKELTGHSRLKEIVLARHIAIYIIREEMKLPLEKIGQLFGNRDHTTIMNAIKKVEANKETLDQSYNRAIAVISDELYKLH